jgi:site-specific DNA-methyltransferase (adenine-specific)
MTPNKIVLADNLDFLKKSVANETVDLIYIDPPFNTGKDQVRRTVKATRSEQGAHLGFGGHRYQRTVTASSRYNDAHQDYLAFLDPRLREAHRTLAPHGSIYLHLDYREVHYAKVLMDAIFGRDSFLNEIIWAYDYGGRPVDRWPAKHDNILLYAKNKGSHYFNQEAIERIPYMAPGLVGPDKAARGKLPTDTWWHTIVPTNSREKTGYPTQKPLGVITRILQASSKPGDIVLDFFAGSGTTGEAALRLARRFLLIDNNPEALAVMARRFAGHPVEFVNFEPDANSTALDQESLGL